MSTDYNFLTLNATLRDLGKVIQDTPKAFLRVPIIDEDFHLCGTVHVSDLKKVLQNRYAESSIYLAENSKQELAT